MKRMLFAAAAMAVATVPASPALAGWKLIDDGVQVEVAKGPLQVTPGDEWNRSTSRPVKQSETWTLDGVNLNELYFISGLTPGSTLYKDRNKKDQPLPTLASDMDLTDIPDFVERSIRGNLNTSVFTVTGVEPTMMGGRQAVRFTYDYAVPDSPLERKGLAVGTMVDGNLHLITFTAPALYFWDRDVAKAEAVIASATL